MTMDMFVSEQNIRNMACNHVHILYIKHENDVTSVRMWVEENKDEVFYYHDGGDVVLEKV